MHTAFFALFPKIAKRETRGITILGGSDAPLGKYYFSTLHCTDPTCDCRRVIVHVLPDAPLSREVIATISYGWESLDFYREWAPFMSDEDLKVFKGPDLDIMQPQSKYASYFLKVFKEQLRNQEYAKRFLRHYAYVKRKVGMRLPLEVAKWADKKGLCPCKSGKPFNQCCGALSMLEKRRLRKGRRKPR